MFLNRISLHSCFMEHLEAYFSILTERRLTFMCETCSVNLYGSRVDRSSTGSVDARYKFLREFPQPFFSANFVAVRVHTRMHTYVRTEDGTRGRVLYLECSRNYF